MAPVTYASGRKGYSITLLVFQIPNAIQREVDAGWDKEEINLAICSAIRKGEGFASRLSQGRGGTWWFVNVARLKGNLGGEADGTSEHLNSDIVSEVCVWR